MRRCAYDFLAADLRRWMRITVLPVRPFRSRGPYKSTGSHSGAWADGKELLGRPLALQGTLYHSCMAGYLRALQADHHRCSLGDPQTIFDHAGIYGNLRAGSQAAKRWKCPVCPHGLCGYASPLVPVFHIPE